MTESLPEIANVLIGSIDKFQQAGNKRRIEIAEYFLSISKCLDELAEQLQRESDRPSAKTCGKLKGHAQKLPQITIGLIEKNEASELSDRLKKSIEAIERIGRTGEGNQRICEEEIREIEEASGTFESLADTVKVSKNPLPITEVIKILVKVVKIPSLGKFSIIFIALASLVSVTILIFDPTAQEICAARKDNKQNINTLLDLENFSRRKSKGDVSTIKEFVPAQCFIDVEDVPTGTFFFGNSTTWIPIIGNIHDRVTRYWLNFQLRRASPLAKSSPGSTTGIRMLLGTLAPQIHIGQSSRPVTQEERNVAKKKGYELQEVSIATDSLVVVVNSKIVEKLENKNSKLSSLTIDNITKIYTGAITDWKHLKGPTQRIIPCSRSLDSGGTVNLFIEKVLEGTFTIDPYTNKVSKEDETVKKFLDVTRKCQVSDLTEGLKKVEENEGAILYGPASEVIPICLRGKVFPLAIAADKDKLPITPYDPKTPPGDCSLQKRTELNKKAFQEGLYPERMTRELYVIYKDYEDNTSNDLKKIEQAGKKYAELLLTDEGQELIEDAGFIRIKDTRKLEEKSMQITLIVVISSVSIMWIGVTLFIVKQSKPRV